MAGVDGDCPDTEGDVEGGAGAAVVADAGAGGAMNPVTGPKNAIRSVEMLDGVAKVTAATKPTGAAEVLGPSSHTEVPR